MLSVATDQVDDVRLGVAVVLRDEDRRQVPHRRQVHRLQRGALVGRAVAEERDPDAAVALELGRQRACRRSAAGRRRRCRWRRACPWTGRRCASSRPCRGSEPVALAEDLGHHRPDVDALGDAVAVPAVGARRWCRGRSRWRRRRWPTPPRRRRGGRTRGCRRWRTPRAPAPRTRGWSASSGRRRAGASGVSSVVGAGSGCRSYHHDPSVDHDRLPGHVVRIRSGEVGDERRRRRRASARGRA